jgi:hypothetical protein
MYATMQATVNGEKNQSNLHCGNLDVCKQQWMEKNQNDLHFWKEGIDRDIFKTLYYDFKD